MSDPVYEAMSKAKRQSESGNVKGAIDTLENYLSTDPHNNKVRLLLANISIYGINDIEYGTMQLDIILDIEPNNVDALKASVTVLMKNKKNNKKVQEQYEKLLSIAPDAELYNTYAVFLKMQMVDFEKSAEYYEKAITLNPNKYEYHQNYAVILLNDLRDYEKAKFELEEVLRLDPKNFSAKKNYDLLIKKKFDSKGNLKKKKLSFLKR
ncbi:MAG: hypothetical protein RBR05_03545 [Candidatus Methanomethylophilaceae archaeon]|nr:hypothetical protein [Candidatus Methanomethylophilaceae archaeon]MDD3378564.1 hypothetical protein [Candidatus Methanomethylophilaceae archaeon]MDY0224458.1 hypothetical protein [Candidatus Methanomethylophilaceae archaeon]